MRVGELCNREVVIIEGHETVTHAARLMAEHHVGCVVVVRRDGQACTPVGVTTDRDLTLRVLAQERPRTQPVAEVMTAEPLTATEDDDLEPTLKRMRSLGVRRVPVINDRGVLQGILAYDDIVEWVADQLHDLTQLMGRERKHEHDPR